MAARLLDANVVLRVLLREVAHPRYHRAVAILNDGGTIRDYVMPEIVYAFLASVRRKNAAQRALERGELSLFERNPRAYASGIDFLPGWKKEAYAALRKQMSSFLQAYPAIKIDQQDLYDTALGIACDTGHDWVDCMLLAEKYLGGYEVCSLDKDVTESKSDLSTMALK